GADGAAGGRLPGGRCRGGGRPPPASPVQRQPPRRTFPRRLGALPDPHRVGAGDSKGGFDQKGALMSGVPHEPIVRLGCFAGVLLLMALWEALAPRRRLTVRRAVRWSSNLGLTALNTLAVRFLVPLGAVGTALLAQERGWGC